MQYGPTPAAGTATFGLPRYREAAEVVAQSATVTVPDDLELTVPGGVNGSWELARQTPQELTWKPDTRAASPPDRLIVAWRAAHQEVRALSDVNLVLLPGVGKVSQELKLQFPRGLPPVLILRQPPGVKALLVKGGALQTIAALAPLGNPLCAIKPDEGVGKGTDCDLLFTYEFSLPDRTKPGDVSTTFAVPLFVPDQPSVGETLVRVWSEPGALPQVAAPPDIPVPANGGWSELAVEPAPPNALRPSANPGRLPVLVVRSYRPDSHCGYLWERPALSAIAA